MQKTAKINVKVEGYVTIEVDCDCQYGEPVDLDGDVSDYFERYLDSGEVDITDYEIEDYQVEEVEKDYEDEY